MSWQICQGVSTKKPATTCHFVDKDVEKDYSCRSCWTCDDQIGRNWSHPQSVALSNATVCPPVCTYVFSEGARQADGSHHARGLSLVLQHARTAQSYLILFTEAMAKIWQFTSVLKSQIYTFTAHTTTVLGLWGNDCPVHTEGDKYLKQCIHGKHGKIFYLSCIHNHINTRTTQGTLVSFA